MYSDQEMPGGQTSSTVNDIATAQTPVTNPVAPMNIAQSSPSNARAPPVQRPRPALREENTIFIGKKPTMGYVLAVATQFQGGAPQCKIKARGQIISKAVDVAEIVRHKFLNELKLGSVSISTEEVENEDGTKSKVSCIEIILL